MIYAIHSNEPLSDTSYIYEEDDEAALEDRIERNFYTSSVVVSDVAHAKVLEKLDYIRTPSGIFLVSQKFLTFMDSQNFNFPRQVCSFTYRNGETCLHDKFWQIIPDLAPIIYEEIDPVRYWPELKKFKNWHFVLREQSKDGLWVGGHQDVLYLMCSGAFMEDCRKLELNLSFTETPTLSS